MTIPGGLDYGSLVTKIKEELIMEPIFIVLLGFMLLALISNRHTYDGCYDDREAEGIAYHGCCHGLQDNERLSDYFFEGCINCPYFIWRDDEKDK